MFRPQNLTFAFLAVFAISMQLRANDIRYTVTDLGTLGGPTSVALAISQNGIVVGGAEVPQRGDHPFVYKGTGPMQDLGLLDPIHGVAGAAESANSKGEVTGWTSDAGPTAPAYAFYYSASGGLIDLGTLGGESSYAHGINENGQIVGYAQVASGTWHGALWTVSGQTIDLGTGFACTAINNTGLIGGVAKPANHAAIYNISSGEITDLGTLGGPVSEVNKMNETGLVVGWSDTLTEPHGFVYDINTRVLADVGNLVSPTFFSNALGVNDLGQVFGGYQIDSAQDVSAFIYTKADGMQDLNSFIDPTSGWDLMEATGGNDAGQIVGNGTNPQGQWHAYLLNPVPEPSSLELAIIVLCVLTGAITWQYCHKKSSPRSTDTCLINDVFHRSCLEVFDHGYEKFDRVAIRQLYYWACSAPSSPQACSFHTLPPEGAPATAPIGAA
jgi:probable HAF family extracellular repeat protein